MAHLKGLSLKCGEKFSSEEVQVRLEAGEKVPTCDTCGGIMKPDVVSFGQAMPERETNEAQRRAAACSAPV